MYIARRLTVSSLGNIVPAVTDVTEFPECEAWTESRDGAADSVLVLLRSLTVGKVGSLGEID